MGPQSAAADLVAMDGAPDVCKQHDFDEWKQHRLILSSLRVCFCSGVLKTGGKFVAKMFRRGHEVELYVVEFLMRQLFAEVFLCKPRASRNSSCEHFIVGKGWGLAGGGNSPRSRDAMEQVLYYTSSAGGSCSSPRPNADERLQDLHARLQETSRTSAFSEVPSLPVDIFLRGVHPGIADVVGFLCGSDSQDCFVPHYRRCFEVEEPAEVQQICPTPRGILSYGAWRRADESQKLPLGSGGSGSQSHSLPEYYKSYYHTAMTALKEQVLQIADRLRRVWVEKSAPLVEEEELLGEKDRQLLLDFAQTVWDPAVPREWDEVRRHFGFEDFSDEVVGNKNIKMEHDVSMHRADEVTQEGPLLGSYELRLMCGGRSAPDPMRNYSLPENYHRLEPVQSPIQPFYEEALKKRRGQ
eukprot:g12914.t1